MKPRKRSFLPRICEEKVSTEVVLTPMIMDLQGFLERLSHLSLLNTMQFSIEIVVSNYVAIAFSRLKSKPAKSKHHCTKLHESNFPLKMISITF